MRGILTSNTLWATDFRDLNDSTELKLIRVPLERALTQRFLDVTKRQRRKSLRLDRAITRFGGLKKISETNAKTFVGMLYASTFSPEEDYKGVEDLRSPAFVTSFCTHTSEEYERRNGLLSQWRAYGGEGGYCLVFDTARLFEFLNTEYMLRAYMTMAVDEVIYFNSEQDVGDIFPDLMRVCEAMFLKALSSEARDLEDIFTPFIKAAQFCKHHAFYEEREVRIAVRPATDGWCRSMARERNANMPPLKPVETGEGDRGRVVLFEDRSEPLPVVRVIVGPSAHQRENAAKVRALLPGVEVHLSATPFLPKSRP